MKIKYYFTHALIFLLLCSYSPAKKCSGDDEYKKGVASLNGFSLVKDYRISLEKGKKNEPAPFVSYPITLTNGMKYKLFGIDNPSNKGKLIVSIFANQKREVLLVTTYNAGLKKHYESAEFTSRTTGNFYISFQYDNGAEGCSVGFFCVAN